jgi:hypothetical protein
VLLHPTINPTVPVPEMRPHWAHVNLREFFPWILFYSMGPGRTSGAFDLFFPQNPRRWIHNPSVLQC